MGLVMVKALTDEMDTGEMDDSALPICKERHLP